jgi:hypothetical protein
LFDLWHHIAAGRIFGMEAAMPFDGKPNAFGVAPALRRERLRELARVVAAVADERFDLRDWSRGARCNSVACAIGWAMRDDWFQRQGFVWRSRGPYYQGHEHWKAVRVFFGLSREEAFDLFHIARYEHATRSIVAERIRAAAEAG